MTSQVKHYMSDNLKVLAIVLIMKKRFLQAKEVFRSLVLSSRHLL